MPPIGRTAQMTPEEFWDDLLAFIEEGRVVPVVGPELHTIAVGGHEQPLYRALAERLLNKYGFEAADAEAPASPADGRVVLRKHLELNDAVIGLSQRGLVIGDLYRPIYDELRRLLGPQPDIPKSLADLASVSDFRLFVSTTIDDLLGRAVDSFGPAHAPVERIAYAPNMSAERTGDLPTERGFRSRAVFHLFGRASPSPFFAIDDEDILEFVYSLQAEQGVRPERMLAELRRCHLLLLGCNFPDWLSRFFIRLANQMRLSGDRPKKEFLVGDMSQDQSLTLFLERFSHNTRVYAVDPHEFVGELVLRWRERRPQHPESERADAYDAPRAASSGGIFLSYTHADIDAARALHSELDGIGAGVIWLDKAQLDPGDEWEPKIKAAVNSCDLFLPLLSANTEARTEGFFRREWHLAAARAETIQGRRFIIPSVIDEDFDPSRFKLVPPGFDAMQFGHAPLGRMNEGLRKTVVDALREVRRRRPD